jgi:Rod binding domain-containing protein
MLLTDTHLLPTYRSGLAAEPDEQNAPLGLDKAHQQLKTATQQFESYFLHQMLQEMRKSIPKDEELQDSGDQQKIFQDMLDQTLADSISKRGDFGIAKMMYDQMKKSIGNDAPQAQVDTHG